MHVSEIINALGGPSEAAKRLGVKRTAVQMWKAAGSLPPRHALAVSRALNVPVEQLLPPAPVPAEQEQAA